MSKNKENNITKKDNSQLELNFSSKENSKYFTSKCKVININHYSDTRRENITRSILRDTKSF